MEYYEQLEFTNREEILAFIDEQLNQYNIGNLKQYIIMIYGMGGIGKSRLLLEIKNKYNSSFEIREISFEIQKEKTKLYSLIRIRKQFKNKDCPLFDYALVFFQEKYQLLFEDNNKCDNFDFQNTLFSTLLDFIPGVSTVVGYVKLIGILKERYSYIMENPQIIDRIQECQIDKCIDFLMELLVEDIKNNCKLKQLFLIDAYNISNLFNNNYDEWLIEFIKSLECGFFIITGRERLEWSKEFESIYFEEIKLDKFPEDKTKELLEKNLKVEDYKYIEEIIKITECIPIYLNFAIDLYKSDNLINWGDIAKKENLIIKFNNHFSQEVQEYIQTLCEIRIFDNRIANILIKKLNLKIDNIVAENVLQTSLFKYLTQSSSFYKFHDILVNNTVTHSKRTTLSMIYNAYFETLLLVVDNYDAEECKILFDNIIFLLKNTTNEVIENCVESAIDILFKIIDNGIQVQFVYEEDLNSNVIDILHLLEGFWQKKRSTLQSYCQLSKIKNPNSFKRHKKSFDVLYSYNDSLLNGYSSYQNFMDNLSKSLTNDEINYWYYGRIKNYLAESYMLQGDIKKSIDLLLEYLGSLDNVHSNEEYQTMRHLGHSYRFSFQLDEAIRYYSDCERLYKSITSLADIYTNLAETYCYIDSTKCFYYCKRASEYLDLLDRKKAKAKIKYSKAIATILSNDKKTKEKRVEEAFDLIAESEKLNKEDGYRAGLIFTYMAKAYIEKYDKNFVTQDTIDEINELTNKLSVYKFFQYFIAELTNDSNAMILFDEFKWIDPDTTYVVYTDFINRLKS